MSPPDTTAPPLPVIGERHVEATAWMVQHRIHAGAAHIDPATLRETLAVVRALSEGTHRIVKVQEIERMTRLLRDASLEHKRDLQRDRIRAIASTMDRWLSTPEEKP